MDTPETNKEGGAVVIYSTPVCHFCHAAKEFFSENGVEYTEHDVAADTDKRQEMIDMTGQMGVPVIQIGNDVVIGFDEPKVKELLGL
ncbi:glutaredoxin family protein [Candidatus Nomurabacteria bacterium]|nr:glutaredoxin family protein [Candidatus Kaiserbacteria bacterium]MCB9815345.1 glutaredoxin family protein [Candidatus Nomurabacteria bacterium]MCB9819567.1 glutaredoxin family protein [Candidatus Nomurabacteria bacterium]